MKPRVKFGLIAGVVGLVLNIGVSTAFGICGPIVALLAGVAAGYFAAQQERVSVKNDGVRLGVLAGLIAGTLVFVGQLIGGMLALSLLQASGVTPAFGNIPAASDPAAKQLLYFAAGLGTGTCFGVVGIVLAALGGAGGGYLGTPNAALPPPPAQGELPAPQ